MSEKPMLKLLTGGKTEEPSGDWLSGLKPGSIFITSKPKDDEAIAVMKHAQRGGASFLSTYDYNTDHWRLISWVNSQSFSKNFVLLTVIRQGANNDGTTDWSDPNPGVVRSPAPARFDEVLPVDG